MIDRVAQDAEEADNIQYSRAPLRRAAPWGAASAAGGAAGKGEGACAHSQLGQPRQEERATCLGKLTSFLSWPTRRERPGIMLEHLQPREVKIEH